MKFNFATTNIMAKNPPQFTNQPTNQPPQLTNYKLLFVVMIKVEGANSKSE